ncbi:MAG: AAA family ATPase [Candidatus Krumholzibacteriia bacterium]
MKTQPFPFADYCRARKALELALRDADDTYLLLTGETGSGKTALLQELTATLDRYRYRPLYFSHARQLGPTGLVRVLARAVRVPTGRSHAETVHALVAHLHDEPLQLWIGFDEAHELPAETLAEVRALAECDLGSPSRLRILFCGLPALRERLQAMPSIWRRIVVREEITSLTRDELAPFLVHHFGKATRQRFGDDALAILFERGRALPGYILPAARAVLRAAPRQGTVQPTFVEDVLDRWDLP